MALWFNTEVSQCLRKNDPFKYTNYFVSVNLFFNFRNEKFCSFFQISEAGTKDYFYMDFLSLSSSYLLFFLAN